MRASKKCARCGNITKATWRYRSVEYYCYSCYLFVITNNRKKRLEERRNRKPKDI